MARRVHIWDKAPFIRLLPPLVTGILIGGNYSCPLPVLVFGITASLLACFGHAAKVWIPGYAWRWLVGISINVLLVLTGSLLLREQQITHQINWLGHHLHQAKIISGSPKGIATPGKKSSRIIFNITTILDSSGFQKSVAGSIIIYVPNNIAHQFLPGDQWMLSAASIQQIKPTKNPGSFDYAQYCARQNIYHQGYLKENQLSCIRPSGSFHLPRILAIGQLSALKAMRSAVPENARGLAMALLIGYRNEVDKPLLQAYTNTGVVHVIAVSGMHLGLIFLLLQKALVFPEQRSRFFRWLKAFLVLLVIWLFSGIAGAAASIIRAAFMFSTVLLSKLIRKPMDNIQSICLGAFALLCYNPLWLWDAGFQLSFAALLSIICYQPLVSIWLQVNNPILKGVWDLTAVTLAAQVLTLPISIGQFHQAPVYFLAANLLAVPLSSLALITAILQWLISITGLPFYLPGKITGFLIQQMNTAILHINRLPGAVIDQVEWTPAQTIVVYAFILSLTIWCIKRSRASALWSLLCTILFISQGIAGSYIKSKRELFLAFHMPGQRMVLLVKGENMQHLSTGKLFESPELQAAKRHYQIQNLATVTGTLFRYGNCLFAIPENPQTILPLLQKVPDYLFLPVNLQKLDPYLPDLNTGTLFVIDGSIPEWRARQWQQLLKERHLGYYSTWESGALQIPINKF